MKAHEMQYSSALLSLPVELRLEIYKHMFSVPAHPANAHRVLQVRGSLSKRTSWRHDMIDGSVSMANASSPCSMHFLRPQIDLTAMFRTCSQMYFESRLIFWSSVDVHFDPLLLGISSFLHQSSYFTRHAITSITIPRQVHSQENFHFESADRDWGRACMQLASGLPNLQEVKVLLSGDIGDLAIAEVRDRTLGPIIDAGWAKIFVLKIRFEGLLAEAEAVESLVSLGGLAWVEGGDAVLWRYISFKCQDGKSQYKKTMC